MKLSGLLRRLSSLPSQPYNLLTSAIVLAALIGCGKLPPRPPGAEEETKSPVIEEGADMTPPQDGGASPSSPSSLTEEKPPADDSGAK